MKKPETCSKDSISIQKLVEESKPIIELMNLAFNAEIVDLSVENNTLFEEKFEEIFKNINDENIRTVVKENSRRVIGYLLQTESNKIKGGARGDLILRIKNRSSYFMKYIILIFIGFYLLYTAFSVMNKLISRGGDTDELTSIIYKKYEEELGDDLTYIHFLVAFYNSIFSKEMYYELFSNISKNIQYKLTERTREIANEIIENCSTGSYFVDTFLSFVSTSTGDCIQTQTALQLTKEVTDFTFEVNKVVNGIRADYTSIFSLLQYSSMLICGSFYGIYYNLSLPLENSQHLAIEDEQGNWSSDQDRLGGRSKRRTKKNRKSRKSKRRIYKK
jgi:hypothetical protein